MSILDQNLSESISNEYEANKRKKIIILFCFAAMFLSLLIYNYTYFKLSFETILWESFLSTIFSFFIPGIIAMVAYVRAYKNPRDTFLIVFGVQSILIISAILVFSLKNDNLIAIYLATVVLAAIILPIFYSAKSGWRVASLTFFTPLSNWEEAGLFNSLTIGVLIVFMVAIFLLTGRLGIPGPLLWIPTLAIVGWFATIKYKKNMEKQLGRKVKGEHELVSLSSWIEAPNEKRFATQKNQARGNQRMLSMEVNTSAESRNSTNNLPNSIERKNQDNKIIEKPFGAVRKDFDTQKQIQMRENLTSLLETVRTKGSEALGEEIDKIMHSKAKDSNSLTIDQSLELGKPLEPRIYHYLFAHKYLPDKLLENPLGVASWLTGEKGIEHLRTRWALLPTIYKLEAEDFIEPTGMNRYVLKPTSRHIIILVQFPKPERVSEAFFGAIFIQSDNSYRYITLERTFEDYRDGTPKTVLGEWVKGNHANLGPGCSPNIEDFSASIIERFI